MATGVDILLPTSRDRSDFELDGGTSLFDLDNDEVFPDKIHLDQDPFEVSGKIEGDDQNLMHEAKQGEEPLDQSWTNFGDRSFYADFGDKDATRPRLLNDRKEDPKGEETAKTSRTEDKSAKSLGCRRFMTDEGPIRARMHRNANNVSSSDSTGWKGEETDTRDHADDDDAAANPGVTPVAGDPRQRTRRSDRMGGRPGGENGTRGLSPAGRALRRTATSASEHRPKQRISGLKRTTSLSPGAAPRHRRDPKDLSELGRKLETSTSSNQKAILVSSGRSVASAPCAIRSTQKQGNLGSVEQPERCSPTRTASLGSRRSDHGNKLPRADKDEHNTEEKEQLKKGSNRGTSLRSLGNRVTSKRAMSPKRRDDFSAVRTPSNTTRARDSLSKPERCSRSSSHGQLDKGETGKSREEKVRCAPGRSISLKSSRDRSRILTSSRQLPSSSDHDALTASSTPKRLHTRTSSRIASNGNNRGRSLSPQRIPRPPQRSPSNDGTSDSTGMRSSPSRGNMPRSQGRSVSPNRMSRSPSRRDQATQDAEGCSPSRSPTRDHRHRRRQDHHARGVHRVASKRVEKEGDVDVSYRSVGDTEGEQRHEHGDDTGPTGAKPRAKKSDRLARCTRANRRNPADIGRNQIMRGLEVQVQLDEDENDSNEFSASFADFEGQDAIDATTWHPSSSTDGNIPDKSPSLHAGTAAERAALAFSNVFTSAGKVLEGFSGSSLQASSENGTVSGGSIQASKPKGRIFRTSVLGGKSGKAIQGPNLLGSPSDRDLDDSSEEFA
ncbi:expressed unknown protein [Seminavis robusta]|uniref:Uncharacterized protein n=1 Tax=Seminavis robusta TaxID=568900 RepID=A0A9N8ER40_9STRA|nr:expressed unknown protein [Seminavis robusta]|eukprot:Sro1478_g276010.1 n/a (780) ;mRNA; f:1321-3660